MSFCSCRTVDARLVLSYVKGHRLASAVTLAWGAALISAVLGDVPLPMPPIFSGITPPVTIDAVLALLVIAAILRALTTPLAYFEEISSKRWRAVDVIVIVALAAPSFWVALASGGASMLARDVAIYLALGIIIARQSSAGGAAIVLSMWLIAQCAVYGAWDGAPGRIFTVILRNSPTEIVWPISGVALVLWGIFGGRIKTRAGGTTLSV